MTHKPSPWRHVRAILQLPFMVTVVVPLCLLLLDGGGRRSWLLGLFGLAMIGMGLALIVTTVRLLHRIGRGTLAPWDPTVDLVVAGPYRYVRNPMITGVFAVLLGETLMFHSIALLLWSGGFIVANVIYMHFSEEPGLRRRFGEQYVTYAANVPAWIPRRAPWHQPRDEHPEC